MLSASKRCSLGFKLMGVQPTGCHIGVSTMELRRAGTQPSGGFEGKFVEWMEHVSDVQ